MALDGFFPDHDDSAIDDHGDRSRVKTAIARHRVASKKKATAKKAPSKNTAAQARAIRKPSKAAK